MITFVDHTVHLTIGAVFLVLDKSIFVEALRRGKAVRRAQAQRAREASMAEAAAHKREERTT